MTQHDARVPDVTEAVMARLGYARATDAAEAQAMLQSLMGRRHRVLTAVGLAKPSARSEKRAQALSTSWVEFAPVPAADIRRYVASGEPMGKAGAYAIQGQAALWVSHISGSYSGIMGLPAFETAQVFAALGMPLQPTGAAA